MLWSSFDTLWGRIIVTCDHFLMPTKLLLVYLVDSPRHQDEASEFFIENPN